MKHSSVTATIIVVILISLSFSTVQESITCSGALNTDWGLTITGLVDIPLTLRIADLVTMPQTTLFAQIYCVGPPGFFVEEGNWTGVKLNFLLQKAGINSTAIKIAFYATDGFSTDLTPLFAMDDSVIVAYEKNNLPLDETLRLVVPGRWGYKWIYHLSRIEAVDYNFLGKYESQGYSDTAFTTTTGGSGDVGDQLPNPTALNRNSPSPTGRPTPSSTSNINSPSPSASHSTTPNTESGTGFKVEETIYLIAAVTIVIAALMLFYYQQKRRKRF